MGLVNLLGFDLQWQAIVYRRLGWSAGGGETQHVGEWTQPKLRMIGVRNIYEEKCPNKRR